MPVTPQTAFRVDPETLERIDEKARAYGLNRTAYIIAACLGELDGRKPAKSKLEDELAEIHLRLQRLELFAFPGEA